MLGFGLWWMQRQEARARAAGEGFGDGTAPSVDDVADDPIIRERASTAREFDPAEMHRSEATTKELPVLLAALPLVVVVAVNLVMSLFVLPNMDAAFLAEPRWGGITLSSVAGVWSVAVALFVAILVLLAIAGWRVPSLRATMAAGANASVLPIFSVASLVGFGAVVAAMPAFEAVRDWVLGIGGGPLVSLASAVTILAALTGSASGGLTIALDALGPTYMALAAQIGLDPGLMHRVAVISAGTLDALPHNGAVVTLFAVCGSNHRDSYLDIVMTTIVSALLALVAVIVLGSLIGSF
jgi:H+/gluconate symporter-like permease